MTFGGEAVKEKSGKSSQGKADQACLVCDAPEDWRRWLENHHQSEKGVWLKIRRAGSAKPGVDLAEAVTEALCYGWIDSVMHALDEDSYVLRFTPRKPGSVWSRINRDRAEMLIAEGRMSEAGLKSVQAARESGWWDLAYTSKEAPVCPADLLAALGAEAGSLSSFEAWTNSEKSSAIFWISQAKKLETRERRIAKVVRLAKAGVKLGG